MFWGLLARLMFKACLPLILLAGVLTYGYYLRGGDPGALWKGIAGRASDQLASLFSGVGDDASRAASALTRGAASATGGASGNGPTRVFTWKDADGVTHYSSAEPTDVSATAVSVDPNVNVLAPVSAPAQSAGSRDNRGEHTDEADGQLPGVAGQVLSTRSDRQGAEAAPGTSLDPAQLLRMLQAAEK